MNKTELWNGVKGFFRKVDDSRRMAMLKVWTWVGDSPQKAGWFALLLVVTSFLLGRWSA